VTEVLTPELVRERVERALPEWLQRQRWYSGGGDIGAVRCEEFSAISQDPNVVLAVVLVEAEGSEAVRYNLPLAIGSPSKLRPSDPAAVLVEDGDTIVFDALADARTAAPIWQVIAGDQTVTLREGRLIGEGASLDAAITDISPLVREQSNTSLVVGNDHLLKVMRKVVFQPSVELEMTRALADASFEGIATAEGWLNYERDGEAHGALLAMAQRFLHNGTEGWTLALTSLRDLYADAEENGPVAASDRVEAVENQGSSFVPDAARLGDITARMHLALAGATADAMRPEPITPAMRERWVADIFTELDRLLASADPALTPLHDRQEALRARVGALLDVGTAGIAIRVHGDYHLGQVLRTDSGWTVLDFEGEPLRPVAERRRPQSPMRDVAGMLRSFDYASAVALTERGVQPGSAEWAELAPYGRSWSTHSRDAFWAAYLEPAAGTPLVPDASAALTLRRAFEIAKAVYEVGYELAHRPQWVTIPLSFLLEATP
jgi:maltokinase